MLSRQEKISGTLLLIGLCALFVMAHCLAYWSSIPAPQQYFFKCLLWVLPVYMTVCCVHIGLIVMGMYEPKEATEEEIKKIYDAQYKDLEKSQ